ncbi:MAG: efflux RND transporter periplasmic adaptor subunit [Candidatus Solibacter usitatus]|nr:efflux RND transporter periplasmic adaptor subunit [Candidatus Solibacter usitatus]
MKTGIRIVVVLALLAAAGVGLSRAGFFKKNDPNIIRLSGNIELTQVDLSFKVPGRLIALEIREGSRVTKGMAIARIDLASVEKQKTREQAGLQSAQAQLAQAETALQLQRETIEGDLQLRRAELRAAEANLADLQAGARPQELQTARAQVDDMRTWLDQAKRDWDRAQTLFKDEDISRAQHEQFRSKFESQSQTLRQAEQRMALLEEGPRKLTIESSRAQVDRAKAAIRLAEANRIDLKRREQEIDVRRAEIRRAAANIAVIDTQLDDSLITSPIDGVVLVKSAEPGETIAAGATVASIGDLARPWLRAYISEKDLGRVKLGTKVKLTTDSYPGKVYAGEVIFIASEAEFTPKQIQTQDERVKLVYKVKILVDNPNQELKANMPVDAELVL